VGAIIAALVGTWLLTKVIVINGIGDINVHGVPMLKALVGAIILVAVWQLLTSVRQEYCSSLERVVFHPRPEKSRRSHEKGYLVSLPRETTVHAGGKLLVATRSAPHKVRGEAYCIGYIDASRHSYGVYQIHMKGRFLLKEACSGPPFRA